MTSTLLIILLSLSDGRLYRYIALGQMRKYDYLHDLRAPRSATHLFPHNSKLSTPAERGMAEHQRMASARLASPRVE